MVALSGNMAPPGQPLVARKDDRVEHRLVRRKPIHSDMMTPTLSILGREGDLLDCLDQRDPVGVPVVPDNRPSKVDDRGALDADDPLRSGLCGKHGEYARAASNIENGFLEPACFGGWHSCRTWCHFVLEHFLADAKVGVAVKVVVFGRLIWMGRRRRRRRLERAAWSRPGRLARRSPKRRRRRRRRSCGVWTMCLVYRSLSFTACTIIYNQCRVYRVHKSTVCLGKTNFGDQTGNVKLKNYQPHFKYNILLDFNILCSFH